MGGAGPLQIGPDIQPGFVRRILRVSIDNTGVVLPSNVGIAQGDAAVPLRRPMFATPVGTGVNWSNNIGRKDNIPLFICRPQTSFAVIQQDRIYVTSTAPGPIWPTITMEYMDTRG